MAEETFGKRLKRLREQAGLTQQQLADQTNTHRISIVKLEQDVYGPSWDTVQAISKVLGVSCAAFEGTVKPSEEAKQQPRKRGRPRKAPPAESPPEPEAKPKKGKGKKP